MTPVAAKKHAPRPPRPYTLPKRPMFDPVLRDANGIQVRETKEGHQARFAAYKEAHRVFRAEWAALVEKHGAAFVAVSAARPR